jgi:hypothetical protein
MSRRDEVFRSGNKAKIWQKYCGFLHLSLSEYMEIQERLLLEQIELVASSPLGQELMGKDLPQSLSQFRSQLPLTTYSDYRPYLEERREDVLATKPHCWVHTSGRDGYFKWVPYTQRGYQRLIDFITAALILASATKEGEVCLGRGLRIMFDSPPRPYIDGQLALGLNEQIGHQAIPPLEIFAKMTPQERMKEEFNIVLGRGLDFVVASPQRLVALGESFTEQLDGMGLLKIAQYPVLSFRLARAMLRGEIKAGYILPCDLWPIKGIISTSAPSSPYHNQISYYWGDIPYSIYLAAEAGGIALPSWNNSGMIFTPYSGFLEFIPEEEWGKASPSTVPLSELEEGKHYEVVVTNFYAMPFLRYRLGDIIEVLRLSDEEMNIRLPHVAFESRADELIDIALLHLDERKIHQAIRSWGIKCEDWVLAQENLHGEPTLHLYIELKPGLGDHEVEQLILGQSKAVSCTYEARDSKLPPLVISFLSPGTFHRYYQLREKGDIDAACSKPIRMNPPPTMIQELLRLSRRAQT